MSLRSLLNDHNELYYMAPISNARLIAAFGILSYNQIHNHRVLARHLTSIADPAVNLRRHGKTFDGNRLHDFVPLYWATHTPMQYVITMKNATLSQDDLVFFILDAEEILMLPDVWTTDGNAANDDTAILEGSAALSMIDWRFVDTRNAYSKDYKRRKCAEVLVRDNIAREHIREICVRSEDVAGRLASAVEGIGRQEDIPSIGVSVRPSLYY